MSRLSTPGRSPDEVAGDLFLSSVILLIALSFTRGARRWLWPAFIVFAAIAGSCVAFAFRFLLVARNRRASLPAA